ncbi:predicted protein [Brucella abortus bv. 4 str. 292]|nr:hypothetical protein BAA13334_I01255 [Brucella abortus A13334]AIB19832.1 Hypothetical protein BSSP3_II1155 [Brucella suis bv. 2]EEX55886.1 predicted protein [Brucella abortus bv. 4 str. 292]EEX59707.1 predicted protein [Brucella abortus bv. 2 str. 86/8/59]EEX62335.1 predicted protein [Brucella abortus bv. 6 str. 870]EEX81018.1 predicted protein [Brucella abortus bv. 9 str. C68]EEY28541.1 predicted protein [Brucella suis bv. 5 str. 513]EEY31794.1 predicted protein [Brucella suis bv. 3 str.
MKVQFIVDLFSAAVSSWPRSWSNSGSIISFVFAHLADAQNGMGCPQAAVKVAEK